MYYLNKRLDFASMKFGFVEFYVLDYYIINDYRSEVPTTDICDRRSLRTIITLPFVDFDFNSVSSIKEKVKMLLSFS